MADQNPAVESLQRAFKVRQKKASSPGVTGSYFMDSPTDSGSSAQAEPTQSPSVSSGPMLKQALKARKDRAPKQGNDSIGQTYKAVDTEGNE